MMPPTTDELYRQVAEAKLATEAAFQLTYATQQKFAEANLKSVESTAMLTASVDGWLASSRRLNRLASFAIGLCIGTIVFTIVTIGLT